MPPSITTIPGTCCCGGTGVSCCVNGSDGVGPFLKPTIYLTLLFDNCPELSGVSLPLHYTGSPASGGGFRGWRYADGAAPPVGVGSDSYVYHHGSEVVIGGNVVPLAYWIAPTVVACESSCGDTAFYFRGVIVFGKTQQSVFFNNTTICSVLSFMANGQTTCGGFCLPCASPINLSGTFVNYGSGDPAAGGCNAPLNACPEQVWCQPTFRGTYTE